MADYADAVFDGIKSLKDDWGLRIEAFSVSLPTPKLVTQSIPGADGLLDLTEAFGYVAYNNRKIVITASIIEDIDDWSDLLSEILAYLHGQSRNVTFDFDSTHYYVGRFAVDASLADAINSITITGDVYPFRLSITETEVRVSVMGETSQTIYIGRMGTIPTISSSVTMPVVFNGKTYTLDQGENETTDIFLVEGANTLALGASGTEGEVVIRYREGAL